MFVNECFALFLCQFRRLYPSRRSINSSSQHKSCPHDFLAIAHNFGLMLVHSLTMPRCVRHFLALVELETPCQDVPPPLTKHRKLPLNQSQVRRDNLGLPGL